MPVIGGVNIRPDELPGPVRGAPARPSLGSLVRSAGTSVLGNLRYGLPYQVEKLAGTASAADDEYYQAWLGDTARRAQEIAPQGPAGLDDLTSGRVGIGRTIAENLAYSLPYMAGAVVGGVAGGAAGGLPGAAAGATIGGTPVFSATNVARAAEDGTLTQGEAIKSAVVAPVQAGLDAAIGAFLPGVGKAATGAVTRGFLTRTAVAMGKAAATEAVTETAQQVGERFAAGLPMTNREAVHEMVSSFAIGGLLGGVMGAGGGIIRRTDDPGAVTDEQLEAAAEVPLLPAPVAYGDAAGRTVVGAGGDEVLRATPRPGTPDIPVPGESPPQLTYQPAMFGDEGQVNPVLENPLSKELRNLPGGDLLAALERASVTPDTPPQVVQAIEAELAAREANPELNPAEPTFADRLGQIRAEFPSQFTKKLEAANEEELIAKVNDYVVNQAKGGQKGVALAQRLGLLDETGAPTELAKTVSSTLQTEPEAAPAAASAPEVDTWISSQIKNRKFLRKNDPARSLTAQSMEDLDVKLYEGLAGSRDEGTESGTIDKLAKARGIIDDEGRLTETGMAIAARTAPFEEIMAAAEEEGFTGAEAAAFERGARSLGSKQPKAQPKFKTAGEKQAFVAGRRFAVPVNRADSEIQAAMTGDGTERLGLLQRETNREPSAGRTVGAMNEATAEVDRQRRYYLAIDEMQVPPAVADQKNVLRRMFDEGATDEQMDAAASLLKSGQSLLVEQDQAPVIQSPSLITGAPNARRTARQRAGFIRRLGRQLEAGEISQQDFDAEMARVGVEGELTVDQEGALRERNVVEERAAERKARDVSRKTKLLREEIHAARESGDLSVPASMRLLQLLAKGDRAAVLRGLPGAVEDPMASATGDPPMHEAVAMELQLEGANIQGVVDYLRKRAPTKFDGILAGLVGSAVNRMQRAGMKFDFKIAHVGDTVPRPLLNARALARLEAGNTTVWLNGSDIEGKVGMYYEVLMHEMVHAVTSLAIVEGKKNAKTAVGRAAKDLLDVSNTIISHFNNRAAAGNMTEFETKIYNRMNNALANEREIVAWALTNPEMQEYLSTIEYTPKVSLLSRLIEAIGTLLRLPVKYNTALTEVVRVAELIMADPNDEVALMLASGKWTETQVVVDPMYSVTAAATSDKVRQGLQSVTQAADALNAQSIPAKLRKAAMGWMSVQHMARQYGKLFGEENLIDTYNAVHGERRATETKFAQLFEYIDQRRGQVTNENPDSIKRTDRLMELTEFDIDPMRPWSDHTHLVGMPNEAELRQLVREGNNIVAKLRTDGHLDLYQSLRDVNETGHYAMMATTLYNLISVDPELSRQIGVPKNPVDEFRESPELNETPKKAREYWQGKVRAMQEASNLYIGQLRGETVGKGAKAEKAVNTQLNPLEQYLKIMNGQITRLARSPYFHMGRFGERFVSFQLKTDGKVVSKKALNRMADIVTAAGFDDIMVSRESLQNSVYIRVNNAVAEKQLVALAHQLEAEGMLYAEADDKRANIKSGPRSEVLNPNRGGLQVDELERLVQAVKAAPAYQVTEDMTPDEKKLVRSRLDELESNLREAWLDSLPDTAMAKMMVKRKGVIGASKDMYRSFAFRYQISTNALASLAATPKFSQVFTEMRSAAQQSLDTRSPLYKDRDAIHDAVAELTLREAQQVDVVHGGMLDQARGLTHAYFLGFSPAYVMLNMTQIGALLWPELGRKHSFVKSAKAISRATPTAFKVLKVAFDEAKKAGGWKGAADVVITADVLTKAGLSGNDAKFVMKMVASGIIDIGSAARELGRVVEAQGGTASDTVNSVTRYASSFGLYSETFNRLIAAMSARELHGGYGPEAEKYAAEVVNQSMLNYSNYNTARWMGKSGFLGQATPIVTQFLQYSMQVLEKLYSDFYTGVIPNNSSAAEKREARRFLASHLAAVTALAGTLGLPLATAAAGALERLVDLFDDDDEPFDATASWQNFLTDMFGPGVAEVIARGAPRAIGIDISSRAGEQDILPFSKFLADRRAWKDKFGGFLEDRSGPSLSALGNMITMGEKFSEGDFMGGLIEGMPTGLRNPVKTYQMATDGYKDARGNALPITPTAMAYLSQLIGFTPADKAMYQEARGDQQVRRGLLTREANELRKKVAQAWEDGDGDAVREYWARAQKFSADNPGFAITQDEIAAAIRRRQRGQAQARALLSPVGVTRADVDAQEMTRYAQGVY